MASVPRWSPYVHTLLTDCLSLLPVFRACLSLRFLTSRRWQELWRLTIWVAPVSCLQTFICCAQRERQSRSHKSSFSCHLQQNLDPQLAVNNFKVFICGKYIDRYRFEGNVLPLPRCSATLWRPWWDGRVSPGRRRRWESGRMTLLHIPPLRLKCFSITAPPTSLLSRVRTARACRGWAAVCLDLLVQVFKLFFVVRTCFLD